MSQQQPPSGYGPPPGQHGHPGQPQGYAPPQGYPQQAYAPPPKAGMSTAAKVLIGLGVMGVMSFGACATCAVVATKGAADAVNQAGVTPGSTPAAGEAAQAGPALDVQLETLLSEYKDNEVRADANYKGKVIKISGKVDDIKKDILNSPYVTVGTGKQFEIPQVQCMLRKDASGAAMQLSKGADVTVIGKVDGLMMNVLVRDCSIQ